MKIDTSIPYQPLLMVYQGPSVQDSIMPKGFHLSRPLKHKKDWCSLMCRLNFFENGAQAEKAWNEMAGKHPETFENNFWFLTDENGRLAAACGIWPGNHLGENRMRLHYLGVDPAYQNRHLASLLVQHALYEYSLTSQQPLYLSTQVQSWPAIVLYEKMGFVPWKQASKGINAVQAQKAWKEAEEIIQQKVSEKKHAA